MGRINKTNLPFDVSSMVSEKGRNQVEYHVKVKARFEQYNVAQDIVINVPVPTNTSTVNMKTTGGKCQYSPTKSVIEWNVPITMQFTIPMWPASGIKVRFLNVQEPKMNYKSIKWV